MFPLIIMKVWVCRDIETDYVMRMDQFSLDDRTTGTADRHTVFKYIGSGWYIIPGYFKTYGHMVRYGYVLAVNQDFQSFA